MATLEGRQALRVRVGETPMLTVDVNAKEDTMESVARQVRVDSWPDHPKSSSNHLHFTLTGCIHPFTVGLLQVRKVQGWEQQQHMRFISAGQELFMDDSVSKALGSVLHCIASQSPAHKFPAPKAGHGQKGTQHSPAVDWVRSNCLCVSLSLCVLRVHLKAMGLQAVTPLHQKQHQYSTARNHTACWQLGVVRQLGYPTAVVHVGAAHMYISRAGATHIRFPHTMCLCHYLRCCLQLEMVDPGTVLMYIFGSILALLWLLFVCYGELPSSRPLSLMHGCVGWLWRLTYSLHAGYAAS